MTGLATQLPPVRPYLLGSSVSVSIVRVGDSSAAFAPGRVWGMHPRTFSRPAGRWCVPRCSIDQLMGRRDLHIASEIGGRAVLRADRPPVIWSATIIRTTWTLVADDGFDWLGPWRDG